MKINMLTLPALVLIFGLLMGCQSKDNQKLSTDLIDNPNSATGKVDKESLPKFEFKETEHDFGTIMQGEIVSYAFRFKNVGRSDLLISNARATCGCTVPEYPKKPIKPGDEGKILVTFNTSNRKGMQNKSITITSNTQPNFTTLRIKAKVMENIENEIINIGG